MAKNGTSHFPSLLFSRTQRTREFRRTWNNYWSVIWWNMDLLCFALIFLRVSCTITRVFVSHIYFCAIQFEKNSGVYNFMLQPDEIHVYDHCEWTRFYNFRVFHSLFLWYDNLTSPITYYIYILWDYVDPFEGVKVIGWGRRRIYLTGQQQRYLLAINSWSSKWAREGEISYYTHYR